MLNYLLELIEETISKDKNIKGFLLEGQDYQKSSERITGHEGNLDDLLDGGGQDNKPPYKEKRPQKRAKSAAPGYPGGLEEGSINDWSAPYEKMGESACGLVSWLQQMCEMEGTEATNAVDGLEMFAWDSGWSHPNEKISKDLLAIGS